MMIDALENTQTFTTPVIKNMTSSVSTLSSPESLPPDGKSWQCRYLEMQQNYRMTRKKNREQANMSQKLIQAVKSKLEQTDQYVIEVI